MDIYRLLIKLAKSLNYQNLFQASKEVNGIRLFRNDTDFSKIQRFFLNYLYIFDTIYQDIATKNISKYVLDDNDIYWESYILWRREKGNKEDNKETKQHDVKLIISDKINFPKSEDK
jgi:hypothetical protein